MRKFLTLPLLLAAPGCYYPVDRPVDTPAPVAPAPPVRSADYRTGFRDGRLGRVPLWPHHDNYFPEPDRMRPDRPIMPPTRLIHNYEYEAGYRAGVAADA